TPKLQQKHALKGSLQGILSERPVRRVVDVQNHLGERDACCRALVGWSGHPSVRDHQARGSAPALGFRRSGDIDDVPAEFTGRDDVALSGLKNPAERPAPSPDPPGRSAIEAY